MEKEKRGKIDYNLLYKLEAKYENLSDCPNDDKDLRKLRRAMNLPEEGIGEQYRRRVEYNRIQRERDNQFKILGEEKEG